MTTNKVGGLVKGDSLRIGFCLTNSFDDFGFPSFVNHVPWYVSAEDAPLKSVQLQR